MFCFMHIEFEYPVRVPFAWQTRLCIGRAADSDIVLNEPGVAERHLCLRADARGVWLQVERGAGHVYVNARRVRERALLRAGDCLGIGRCRLWLVDEAAREAAAEPDVRPPVAALRAVAGPFSGRVWSIGDGLSFGGEQAAQPLSLPDAQAAGRVEFAWRGHALWVRGDLPERYRLRVNGRRLDEARLQHGDHLGVGAHRWVLDAAGLDVAPPAPPAAAPAPAAAAVASARPRGELGWLIVTAAVLGLILALLFIVRI